MTDEKHVFHTIITFYNLSAVDGARWRNRRKRIGTACTFYGREQVALNYIGFISRECRNQNLTRPSANEGVHHNSYYDRYNAFFFFFHVDRSRISFDRSSSGQYAYKYLYFTVYIYFHNTLASAPYKQRRARDSLLANDRSIFFLRAVKNAHASNRRYSDLTQQRRANNAPTVSRVRPNDVWTGPRTSPVFCSASKNALIKNNNNYDYNVMPMRRDRDGRHVAPDPIAELRRVIFEKNRDAAIIIM